MLVAAAFLAEIVAYAMIEGYVCPINSGGMMEEHDLPFDRDSDAEGMSFGLIGFSRNTDTMASIYGLGAVAASQDANVTANGAIVAAAGNDMHFVGMAGIAAAGNSITLQDARIGVLLAGDKINAADVHVLMRTPQAAAFGAGFGVVFALLTWLLRRR